MSDSIVNTNKIFPSISQQLPEFVRIDHPSFVAFLEAYYEWLDSQGSNLYSSNLLSNVKDVDNTFDEFVNSFKKQYLLDFPESLAVNSISGSPVNEKTLIKHIKSFYKAKGTEKAYELLFRVLYDTNLEFYYPKVDLLKVSDGKWISKKALRISTTNGNKLFQCLGKRVYQSNSTGIFANAYVSDIAKLQIGVFTLFELIITNINGSFVTTSPISIQIDSDTIVEPTVYSVVSSITILSGGSNYRVGDTVTFTNITGDIGQGAKAKVSQVSSVGKILKIKIENFGVNYLQAPTITISSQKGTGFSGTCTIGALCNFEGYYANSDGKLSSTKVIQDSHYYQNYSYVLKSEIVIDKYKNIIKRLIHPAGLGFFGQILIKRCAFSNLDACNSLSRFEVPLIGHYVAYTPMTHDTLEDYFAAGFDPSMYTTMMTSYPNPVSSHRPLLPPLNPLSTTGFTRADPFWIVYEHPNRRITGNVIARIEKNTSGLTTSASILGLAASLTGYNMGKNDFLRGSTGATSWAEWTMTGSTERYNWANSFTSDFKYALLKYTSNTEMRKITLNSFLHMPIGDEYDCRYDLGIAATHGGSPNF
jgi:hypothetical protein